MSSVRRWPIAGLMLVLAGCGSAADGQAGALQTLARLVGGPEPSEMPASQDRDGDGLTDEQEDQLGTHHADPDTDGDGVSDFQEIENGTDPTTARRQETVEGLPTAFDGVIHPGESRVFYRGAAAPATAYLRLMGLVRQETRLSIAWQEIDQNDQPITRATTTETSGPREYWCWGHDLGAQAAVSQPANMIVTQLEVTVLGGDSVFYNFISSGGLANGPRGFLPFPEMLAEAELNFTLLMAHGLGEQAASWDSFAIMAERISDDLQIIRTDVSPTGTVSERAGELARFILRQDQPEIYAVGHSMGGLDLRYILTKASENDPAFIDAGQAIQAVYTIATPHRGAFLAALTNEFPEFTDFIDVTAPAVIDLQPGSNVLDYLNESFEGDVTIEGRTVPVVALSFHAGSTLFADSDGIVEISSQAFGDHIIGDVPSTRGAGLGAGKHTPFIPTRADPELESYEVLARILTDIVQRRQATRNTQLTIE